jgi:hypothetical protein
MQWLHGVVASAELAGVEEHAEYLDIVLGRDPRHDHTDDEQTDATEERVQQ